MHRLVPFLLLIASLLAGCASSPPPQPFPTSPAASLTPLSTQTTTPTPPAAPGPIAPTPTIMCMETAGQETEIQDPADSIRARVHLPPCFDPNPAKLYPVLYLLHGQGFTADQWQRLGAPEILDRLISSGEIEPLILVLPEEPDTQANPFESRFGPALLNDLIPVVDHAYPTCPDRTCRAIGGLSRGASWAIFLALSRPDLFSAAGAHSLPPFMGLDSRLPGLLAAIPQGDLPALYIDIGLRDRYRVPAQEFEALLNRLNVPHEWYLNEGEHDETYWSAHVEEYLRWYAARFPAER